MLGRGNQQTASLKLAPFLSVGGVRFVFGIRGDRIASRIMVWESARPRRRLRTTTVQLVTGATSLHRHQPLRIPTSLNTA